VGDDDGDDEIYSMATNGKNVTQLTANTGIADDDPTWSPDSSEIAFSSNRSATGNIFVMAADGGGVRTLVGGVWTSDTPAWRR
jgi:Tol biopolymer transport system component